MLKRLAYLAGAYGPPIARHLARSPMWIGPHAADEKVLYLTFDDGPTTHLTPVILDVMSDFDIQGTFFLLGKNVDRLPGLAQEIVRRRHVVGVHGQEHLDAWKTDSAMIEEDLTLAVNSFRVGVCHSLRYYRPPFGRFTRRSLRAADRLGLRVVMWSVMPGDYLAGVDDRLIASRVLRGLHPGAIIVLHDSGNTNVRQHTVPALRRIVETALNDGWSFRPLPG